MARIYPEDREAINKSMEQMLFRDGLSSKASFDYRIIHEEGSVRTIHSERMVRKCLQGAWLKIWKEEERWEKRVSSSFR